MLSRITEKIGAFVAKKLTAEVLPGLCRRCQQMFQGKPMSMAGYIYKTARLTGTSEFEVFRKAAESWPVSEEKIEADFGAYLLHHQIPHYVRDFIRKNQKQLDELRMPLF